MASMKLVFRLAAVFAVFVASMAFFTPVASAADLGIDLNRYCDSQYPGTFAYAALRISTVMDWKCSVSWHGLNAPTGAWCSLTKSILYRKMSK